MNITKEQLQVLLSVLQRAPVTLAEQLVVGSIVDALAAQVEAQQKAGVSAGAPAES